MPVFSLTLPESQQSIIRPVIFDIIKQVQEITKIDPKAKIFFPGESNRMQTPGSGIDSEEERYATFATQRINFVEVQEDFDKGAIGTVSVNQEEHLPVFEDSKLLVQIAPVYAYSDITINFRYRCPNKSEALRWRDDFYMRINQMRDINLHDITYHYVLPSPTLTVLSAVHELRENYLGYGQTFEEYVVDHSTDHLTLVHDLVAKNSSLTISEKQIRILGMFDLDAALERIERDDQTGTYTVTFSYKFSYQRPIGCTMRYPIMVHNQLMPEAFTTFVNSAYSLDNVNKSFSKSMSALFSFENDTVSNAMVNPNAIIRLPEFDDYVLPNVPLGTGTSLLILSEVETMDKKTLFNLRELGDIAIDQDILDFIQKSEYPYLGDLYKSIIHVNLYCDNFSVSNKTLVCDSNLNVSSVVALDLRRQYRVRISLVVDLTMLPQSAFERLQQYPKAMIKIIGAMNELLKNHPDFTNLGDLDYIAAWQMSSIYQILTGYPMNNQSTSGSGTYYGHKSNVNNWPYRGKPGSTLFTDIDPRIVENYRRNRVQCNMVQVTGILALPMKN